jgi:hyperosmotically inducible periplasmic protein
MENTVGKNKLIYIAASVVALLSVPAFSQSSSDATATQGAPTTKKALRMENRQTARDVRKAMTAVKGLQSDKIVVIVKGNTVTLAGTVPEESQIDLAEKAAKSVPKAQTVANDLTVKEPGSN